MNEPSLNRKRPAIDAVGRETGRQQNAQRSQYMRIGYQFLFRKARQADDRCDDGGFSHAMDTGRESVMKLLPAESGRSVWFELSAEPGSRVFVAGTFNNWNPTANPMKDNPDSGYYKAALRLPAGRHEYKFVVNGFWMVDPRCMDCAPNAYGSLNSVLHV